MINIWELANVSAVVGFGFTIGVFGAYMLRRLINSLASISVKFVIGLFGDK